MHDADEDEYGYPEPHIELRYVSSLAEAKAALETFNTPTFQETYKKLQIIFDQLEDATPITTDEVEEWMNQPEEIIEQRKNEIAQAAQQARQIITQLQEIKVQVAQLNSTGDSRDLNQLIKTHITQLERIDVLSQTAIHDASDFVNYHHTKQFIDGIFLNYGDVAPIQDTLKRIRTSEKQAQKFLDFKKLLRTLQTLKANSNRIGLDKIIDMSTGNIYAQIATCFKGSLYDASPSEISAAKSAATQISTEFANKPEYLELLNSDLDSL